MSHHKKCFVISVVTTEEIYLTVKEMLPKKSPRIDGYTVEFFTQQLEVINDDVRQVVAEFFSISNLHKTFSCTPLTLVPKVKSPTYVKEHRPIACSTTFYKLIIEILTNIIKSVIDTIISPSQSSFVEGRSIIDNILFFYELLKQYSRKGLSLRCVMKVNLYKAYDSIEWQFLRTCLHILDFLSNSYSRLWNVSPMSIILWSSMKD